MAFNSASLITLPNPVIRFAVNDWNTRLSVPSITLQASINDWYTKQTLSKPTINFIWNISEYIVVNAILPLPILTSTLDSSIQFNSTSILKSPTLLFKVDVPVTYILDVHLPKISTMFDVGVVSDYQLNIRTLRPVLDFTASLQAARAIQTWAFNTITTAHSRYTNYAFNSFFKIGTKNYSINSAGGIYELTGARDFMGETSEVDINAQIDLPISAFGEQTLKVCSDAILYGRCDGELEIAIVLDEQQERTGFVIPFDARVGMHRTRVKIPKGLQGNVWQFKIKNRNGSHFDINAFEVFLKTLQRLRCSNQ
jgi:hypothetical protein